MNSGKFNLLITALTKVKKYFNIDKPRILFNAFFESQLKYWPLTLLFSNKTTLESTSYTGERYD